MGDISTLEVSSFVFLLNNDTMLTPDTQYAYTLNNTFFDLRDINPNNPGRLLELNGVPTS